MNKIKLTTSSLLSVAIAFAFSAFMISCGGESKKAEETVEEVTEEVEKVVEEVDEHAGHDHASHEGHDHGDDMESMDTQGLNFAEGTWAYNLQQAMDNNSTETFVLDKVPFEGEELSDEADEQLNELATLLKAHPDARVVIKGHTKEAKNAVGRQTKKATSKARALWVQTKLSLKGATGDQMRARGMADEELMEGVPGDDDSQSRITVTLGTKE